MKHDSLLHLEDTMVYVIILLFVGISNTKPIDYEDLADLLPTDPQTTNDTLAAVVQDEVIRDAVQNAVGNGSLEGLVVKKKVLVVPATEPAKVTQRGQVLVVPMAHLEDVRKNITETINAETDVDSLTLTDLQSFIENGQAKYINAEDKMNPSFPSQHSDVYEMLEELSKTPISASNAPREIALSKQTSPAISVPIVAFIDPTKIVDKADVPTAAVLSKHDDSLKSQLNLLETKRNEIQRNVQSYVDRNSWSIKPNDWRLSSTPSVIQVSSSLHEPAPVDIQDVHGIISEDPLSVVMPQIDIVTPLFWTSDTEVNYPKNPYDMDVAADIVFRPLFRFRQKAQQRSWRRGTDKDYRQSTYQRYNPYDSYSKRNYYRPRYADEYYY